MDSLEMYMYLYPEFVLNYSSTNAYMLMYRQVAPERNTKFTELCDVPKHIAELIYQLKHREEMERRRKEMDRSMCKVYFHFLLSIMN